VGWHDVSPLGLFTLGPNAGLMSFAFGSVNLNAGFGASRTVLKLIVDRIYIPITGA
jgi:hypothetical protein